MDKNALLVDKASVNMRDVVAVGFSDLHLTLSPPACRAEENWLKTQSRYLQQVKELAAGRPVICAGDIFDRWNPQPELIYFALRELPNGMCCVPGQHDLPNHSLSHMHRSGYGVLKEAGKINDLSSLGHYVLPGGVCLQGFGWGQEIKPAYRDDRICVAVVHRYVWEGQNKFTEAPQTSHASALAKELRTYKAAIFGDNHKGFQIKVGECDLLNSGGFIRRKSDEINYRPSVGLLLKTGRWVRSYLDTEEDEFVAGAKDKPETAFDAKEFIRQLESLGESGLNYREAVENYVRANEDLPKQTREIINQALNEQAD